MPRRHGAHPRTFVLLSLEHWGIRICLACSTRDDKSYFVSARSRTHGLFRAERLISASRRQQQRGRELHVRLVRSPFTSSPGSRGLFDSQGGIEASNRLRASHATAARNEHPIVDIRRRSESFRRRLLRTAVRPVPHREAAPGFNRPGPDRSSHGMVAEQRLRLRRSGAGRETPRTEGAAHSNPCSQAEFNAATFSPRC